MLIFRLYKTKVIFCFRFLSNWNSLNVSFLNSWWTLGNWNERVLRLVGLSSLLEPVNEPGSMNPISPTTCSFFVIGQFVDWQKLLWAPGVSYTCVCTCIVRRLMPCFIHEKLRCTICHLSNQCNVTFYNLSWSISIIKKKCCSQKHPLSFWYWFFFFFVFYQI